MEDYYDHTQKTIKVDPIRVQLLSYRLLSLFFASEKLHIACSGECNSGADYFASNVGSWIGICERFKKIHKERK
ncbi:MAG: hypothetical protein GX273_04435 [Bacteroidales bacterium]|jgi:hydroxyacyl-ACP dehydratase HTD2-like protein with hotdog domain|nr:hypothetical protein [Bacteroidales bacterium]